MDWDRVRDRLTAAVGGARRGHALAERLCRTCADVLEADGAGLWLVTNGSACESLSTCGALTAELDRRQIADGAGPCWDAVRSATLVTAPDLTGADAARWPAYAAAGGAAGIGAVFAVPVSVAGVPTGALYLCRSRTGALTGSALAGALLAGELAVLPLLDVIADTAALPAVAAAPLSKNDFAWLTRAEIYQAVGMISAQLGVHPAEALLRLRGYGFANDLTSSQVAFQIIEHHLQLEDDGTGTEGRYTLGDWPESGQWPDTGAGPT